MGLVAAMCGVFAILFFKDGAVGYPKEAQAAAVWEDYKKVALDGYDEAVKGNSLEAWTAAMKAKGYGIQDNGQFYWGYAMVAVVLFCGIHVLLNRKKTLRADHDHFITPDGKKVMFADTYRIDKRKWEVKALAYVYYKEGGVGAEKKATIDDLKYHEAGRVLDALLAQFKGEIIEKVAEPEEEEETKEEK
jgi:hypothetical protein